MAFTVATATSTQGGNPTSHTVSLPDGSNVSGVLVLVFFAVDGNPTITWPSGWTSIFEDTVTGNDDPRLSIRYRRIDGTEGFTGTGDTITITTSASERSAHTSYLISDGHHASTAPEAAAAAAANTTTPDPPSLAPSWGAETNLWIPAFATADANSIQSGPTNYTNVIDSTIGDPGGTTLGTARRELNAASEDPGTFTLANQRIWVATTVAVRPAATGTTGSLSETQDAQTLAASGTLGHSGSLAETQADQTLSASGTVVGPTVTGSLAETQDDQTLLASGQLGHSGSLAETQADQTLAASGTVGDVTTGSLAIIQDDNTLAASGQVIITGSLAATQDDQAATATGWIEATGTVAATQADQTLTATGTIVHTGTLVATQADHTLSASGTAFVPAAGPNPIRITHTEQAAIKFREHATITYREAG